MLQGSVDSAAHAVCHDGTSAIQKFLDKQSGIPGSLKKIIDSVLSGQTLNDKCANQTSKPIDDWINKECKNGVGNAQPQQVFYFIKNFQFHEILRFSGVPKNLR